MDDVTCNNVGNWSVYISKKIIIVKVSKQTRYKGSRQKEKYIYFYDQLLLYMFKILVRVLPGTTPTPAASFKSCTLF